MKRFLRTAIQTISALLASLLFIAAIILGYRILHMLTHGIISLSLCGEFLAVVVTTGLLVATLNILSDKKDNIPAIDIPDINIEVLGEDDNEDK